MFIDRPSSQSSSVQGGSLQACRLRCEHLRLPRGLNQLLPELSWSLKGQGEMSAWRIIAGESKQEIEQGVGRLWDSGMVDGALCSIPWNGKVLVRDSLIWWAVQVWDDKGKTSGHSEPAQFFTGLGTSDWQAQWIARYFVLPAGREIPQDNHYDNRFQARPADYLRRNFDLDETPVRAFIYVTALGLYELYINGSRVSDEVMAPGWTDYHLRVEYQSYDVNPLLNTSQNTIGVVLGEGWYSGRIGHNQRRAGNHYGGRPGFMCQLHLEFSDGRIELLISDDQWQTKQGPICYSDFLVGEMYDARLEMFGWSEPQFEPHNWQPVEVYQPEPKAPLLEASRVDPAREVACLEHHSVKVTASGECVYDFGQNLAGYVELQVAAPAGTRILLRHAERLNEQGELYTENLRYAVSEDIYICKGEGLETFKPHFTFHGFQYLGVSVSAPVTDLKLTAIAIQTDLPITGKIKTGNAMVNQLLSNIFWSQRGNFLSVPTDCPQRDERYGWSADAQVFWRTAGYFMDVSAFLRKWMEDLIDGQSEEGVFPDVAPTKPLNPYRLTAQPGAPAWGDAPIILAWHNYLRYEDKALLSRCWLPFVKWMGVVESANPDGIRVNEVHNNYGDWLAVGEETDRALINTAYWIHLADIMADIARVLKKDALPWLLLAKRIRIAFLKRFLLEDGSLSGNTQTAYLLALDFKLLPNKMTVMLADKLSRLLRESEGHLQTGFLGVRHLAPVISEYISPEKAVDLLLKDTYPSWGFSIKQGATTIWERWDGWTPEKGFQSKAMNSFNHYAYGAIGEWIWSRLAGIDWDEAAPGYRKIQMRPIFDPRIGLVDAEYEATTGLIKSHWQMGEPDEVVWDVTLPSGVSASVVLSGQWRFQGDNEFVLASGSHSMTIKRHKQT
ncbi:alpha-L-rhamnosidase [Marinomonas transparens]|uniref:alpha-L-rhamnosidase n=1 Tax=Marinomonas transparens TaxID=2795388 RepID=A0A934MVU4_9GAMM|nr:alpha-L-rhamnosidase [Marinomonas transparens]MBJ7537429.1 family 78 glycoside hydrolase catalytic domain [Marinomonas transparens]